MSEIVPGLITEASDRVATVMDNMNVISENMIDGFNSAMSDMTDVLSIINLHDYYDAPEDVVIEIPDLNLELDIEDIDVGDIVIEDVTEPTLTDVEDIEVDIPDQANVDFNITIPAAPSISIGTTPDIPSMATISIPSMPSYDLPSAPSLDSIVIPDAPTIDIPEFSAVAPSVSADTLPDLPAFNYNEEMYSSDIGIALFQKILDDIAEGGSGLNPDIEQAIYDRMLARQRAENERIYREAEDQLSATGFELPTGAIASRLLEVASEISRKNDQASWEIMVKQAELAQTNTHFTIDKAVVIEQMLRNFFDQQENRRIEAARQAVLVAIEVYKALIDKINIQLEIYKTEAAVYSERLKAKLAEIEIYRARIDGTRALAEIQQARVNIYTAEIQGVEALMKIYSIQMDSARIAMEIEATKMEGFKAQIQAFVAQVEAERAKALVYQAQVDGARGQVDIATAMVNKYNSEVNAAKAKVEAYSIKAQAQIAKNNSEVDVYKAKMEAAKTKVDAEAVSANVQITQFNGKVQQNVAKADATSKGWALHAEFIKSQVAKFTADANAAVEKMRASIAQYNGIKDLLVSGYGAQVTGYANVAASALNALNVSAGIGASASAQVEESKGLHVGHNHSYTPDADNFAGPF